MGVLSAYLLAAGAAGQCAPTWLPGMPVPGVVGGVSAMVAWDRDGSGPQPAVLAVGGAVTIAGGVRLEGVAVFDPVTRVWSALTPSTGFLGGSVNALAAMPNGDLIAAGTFISMAGVAANRIARWNGAAWQPLGSGLNNVVQALAVMPNGNLIAAGSFSTAGGAPANRVAAWDGATWTDLAAGLWNVTIRQLVARPDGTLRG